MINGRLEVSESERNSVKNREIQQQILSVDTADEHVQRLLAEELDRNPYKRALAEVLQEITQQSLSLQQPTSFENEQQIVRLDSMLASEGVTGPENLCSNVGESNSEQREYREKVSVLRKVYQEEIGAYEKACLEFQGPVLSLLEQQGTLRPVSQAEKEVLLAHIQQRFQGIQLQLKESICQAIILLRNRIFDARRKRQNFTKTATVILNEYFYNNLANPYPSEQVRQELAANCNLTVSQVTNWFGNKRIRFKKSFGKADEDLLADETQDSSFGEVLNEKDIALRDTTMDGST